MGPLLVLGIAAILVFRAAEPAAMTEELASLSGPRLSGSLMLSDQLQVGVSLVPLHDDAQRQRFDSVALSKRLGLGEGEPWRLKLVAVSDFPLSDLEGVQVFEGERSCLSPIVDEMKLSEGSVQDPLIGLFKARSERSDGKELELVLWGAAPAYDGQLQCSWGSAALSLDAGEEDLSDSVVKDGGESSDEFVSQD
jgi:hypothetical protein